MFSRFYWPKSDSRVHSSTMETTYEIEIRKELGGNVKVSVTIRGVTIVYVWNMTEKEALEAAEEIVRRKVR